MTQGERLRDFMASKVLRPMGDVLPQLEDGDLMAKILHQMVMVRRGALDDVPWQTQYMALLMEGITMGYRFREQEYQRAVETEEV